MSVSMPSDEVAEDYKNALDDLVSNDRYQIANLTMIAKENIEHAEAISRVLINHINRTPPSRKLPALYVLDSLVKNIGSPYTVYFGRNLHSTFMHAYSQVDAAIRRKLEEMLRTWREPIPGSLSTTPVFPLQSTQSIVDALNRHRASTAPSTGRAQPPTIHNTRVASTQPYRNTPTPPQPSLPSHTMSNDSQIRSPAPQFAAVVPNQGGQIYGSMVPSVPSQAYQAQSRPVVDVSKLHSDIDNLTTDAKIECATHPMDGNARRKLTTLQTLKEILDAGKASEQDLLDIRNTIDQELSRRPSNQIPLANPTPSDPVYPPQNSRSEQSASAAPPSLSFLNQANLADLLRATSGARNVQQPPHNFANVYQQHSTPNYSTPPAAYATLAPVQQPTNTASSNPLSLLEQLRASGFIPPTPGSTPAPPNLAGLPSLLNNNISEVQRTSASIRIPRPQMVKSFLEERPNQCSTCGKRFTSDDTGRERKARHLDWHFKTKARMLEAERRGQNRSWYLDAREWIASKDFDDEGIDDEAAVASSSAAANTQKTQDFVRAPSDPALRNAPCPIDQEPFKSEWSEDVQDFIWKDAIRVGNRYYHASCYREVTKDRDKDGTSAPNNVAARTATPDSVLGKRKAERQLESQFAAKVKVES